MKQEDLQNIPPMEKHILTEEVNTSQEPSKIQKPQKISLPNIASLFQKIIFRLKVLKKPKPITIFIIIFALILVFTGIILIAQDNNPHQEDKTPQKAIIPSPKAEVDEDLQNAQKEVRVFNTELESLDRELGTVKLPKIDLDINFD